MKHSFKHYCLSVILGALLAVAVSVQADPLILNEATFTEALALDTRTSTVTGSAVDLGDYDGYIALTLMSGAATAGTSPTLEVKVTHADTSGGEYTDVSGATWTQVTDAADAHQALVINSNGLKRYIKIVGTIGGTSTPTFAFGVTMVGFKQTR